MQGVLRVNSPTASFLSAQLSSSHQGLLHGPARVPLVAEIRELLMTFFEELDEKTHISRKLEFTSEVRRRQSVGSISIDGDGASPEFCIW